MKNVKMLADNILVCIDLKKVSKYIEVPSTTDPSRKTKVMKDFNAPEKITVIKIGEDIKKVKEGDEIFLDTRVLNAMDDVTVEIGEKQDDAKSYGIVKEFNILAVIK